MVIWFTTTITWWCIVCPGVLQPLSVVCARVVHRLQLTAKELYQNGIAWRDVFTDVPIRIANSPLITALMAQIDEHVVLDSIEKARLRLNAQPFLEKQLERMGESIESLHLEVQEISAYERMSARQEQQKALWLQRRQEVRR
jgi:translation initiation factor 3 subunit H